MCRNICLLTLAIATFLIGNVLLPYTTRPTLAMLQALISKESCKPNGAMVDVARFQITVHNLQLFILVSFIVATGYSLLLAVVVFNPGLAPYTGLVVRLAPPIFVIFEQIVLIPPRAGDWTSKLSFNQRRGSSMTVSTTESRNSTVDSRGTAMGSAKATMAPAMPAAQAATTTASTTTAPASITTTTTTTTITEPAEA